MIVETGEGLSTAQSYVTVEEATAYHTLFGNTGWNDRPDLQESSLVRATQMVDIVWGGRYLSRKATKAQALYYPRLGFYANTGDHIAQGEIPKCLKDAVCELALQQMASGQDLLNVDENSGIKRRKQKVGELEEEIEYVGTNTTKTTQEKYNKVDMLISPIIAQPNFSITL